MVKELIPTVPCHGVYINPKVWLADVVRNYKLGKGRNRQVSTLSEKRAWRELTKVERDSQLVSELTNRVLVPLRKTTREVTNDELKGLACRRH